ncbi:unnamed protein product [Dibothriocephalus latus]|uniref:EF-hand domain-containing protein n=1 Tax=Dibothriocephalus latus TaxID=60516 RepID=A0A3P7LLH8_DIBLA|nr:unnamed protein product [Dibothriocephalus latus]
MKYLYEKKQLEREPVMRDAEGVLDMIKKKVHECRIRLSEWIRDSDRLNHGTVSRQAFRRALGLLPIPLKETELNVLEHYFKAKEENFINWRAFCEEVESVFATPHLEKDPLKEAQVLKTEVGISENYLPIGLAADADAAIKKIGGLVGGIQLLLLNCSQNGNFDQTHRMTLSQSQFRRCLMTLGLADTITEHEWIALYAKYRHPIGEIDNINYLAFSDDVYEVAGMVYRTP